MCLRDLDLYGQAAFQKGLVNDPQVLRGQQQIHLKPAKSRASWLELSGRWGQLLPAFPRGCSRRRARLKLSPEPPGWEDWGGAPARGPITQSSGTPALSGALHHQTPANTGNLQQVIYAWLEEENIRCMNTGTESHGLGRGPPRQALHGARKTQGGRSPFQRWPGRAQHKAHGGTLPPSLARRTVCEPLPIHGARPTPLDQTGMGPWPLGA